MHKFIITVLAKDRPGIIAAVTKILFELDCNLENVNQMILQNQFAGLFLVEAPTDLDAPALYRAMEGRTRDAGLKVYVSPVEENGSKGSDEPGEVFLITTSGPDQKGLVAKFSDIIARHNGNIINLKAVFKGGRDPKNNVMSYQVVVTKKMDVQAMYAELRQKASDLSLDIRIQHKNIFDAINKI